MRCSVTVAAHNLGHKIFWDGNSDCWRYDDDNTKCDTHPRACIRCKKLPTKEGYDACQGYVPGATSVCCGHGVSEPIKILEGE